jgi:transposase
MPKSYATPSLITQIIISKYQFGLPLYRQEQILAQIKIELSRKTMSDWIVKIAAILGQSLYESWHDILLDQGVMRADETPLKVVADDNQKSQMWVYNSGADSPKGNIKEDSTRIIVLYEYQPTRRGQCPVDFLRCYDGYLQVDGHPSYHATEARLVECMGHARRKFIEAQKHQVKGSKKVTKADWAINHIQKLYRVETLIKDMTVEQRYAVRQEKSKPLLDQFKTWLDKSATQVTPDSGTGKAVKYTLNQWEKLIRYAEDGRLNLDNNRSEQP